MLVHFTVPIASSSAVPSTPISMFCDFYVTEHYANYKCSIDTLATQRKTSKVYVS